MIDIKETQSQYVRRFRDMEGGFASGGQAWLLPIRQAALARFKELGFPSTRNEEWRYTNVAPIAGTSFEMASASERQAPSALLKEYAFGDEHSCRLVFVNGRFAPQISTMSQLPDGLKIANLAQVLDNDPGSLEAHLARHAGYEHHAFTALNTAFISDGAFIHIPRGLVVKQLIHLLYFTDSPGEAQICHPRNLIVAEENSQATIVESYAGLDGQVYFNNTVTEIVAKDNAVIDHYKVEREALDAFHIATLQIHQQRSSNVSSHVLSMGGALVRNNINVLLDGEGCECTLNGFSMLAGNQHVDNHLWVEHAKPHCDSREFFKGIYDDRSRGVFSGRIRVHEGAIKTDAKQTNMSLLLSENALADSKPQLEIFTDDVKCTHGATIGQLDDEAIFYLRSRGIGSQSARSLLIFAFANESISQIRPELLRARMKKLLLARLPQGELLRESA